MAATDATGDGVTSAAATTAATIADATTGADAVAAGSGAAINAADSGASEGDSQTAQTPVQRDKHTHRETHAQ